jgi:tight adherence protein B
MNAVMIPLIYLLAFVAVILLVQTAAGLIFAAGDRKLRVNRRLTMMDAGMSRDQVYMALVRRPAAAGPRDQRLARLYGRFTLYCRQAGLSLSPQRIVLVTLGIAGALWTVGLILANSTSLLQFMFNGAASLIAALLLAVAGVWLWLRRQRNSRLKKIEEQLPVALDIVSRALRAGHPVISAIHLAADEMGDPLGSEFGLIVDETIYGIEFEDALANLAERTGSADAHFFAVSINIQSETGGNLAEILQGLSSVIRSRRTLAKRVKSLASEGRASAILISVLPVIVVGIQFIIQPQIYISKFGDPIFWPTVAITAAVYIAGWLIIHRIVNFKY